MQELRKMGFALTLVLAFAVATFAGETSTPPCAPGEMNTPPCASMTAVSESTTPGDILTPPAAESFDVLALAETLLTLVF